MLIKVQARQLSAVPRHPSRGSCPSEDYAKRKSLEMLLVTNT
jgi:hypothetical protein